MEKFDKINLQFLRNEIDTALKAVGEKHNLTLGIGNVSYSPSQFTTTLTVTIGDGSDHERKEFENAVMYRNDIPKDWYGKTFIDGGVTYKIIGVKSRSPKMPMVYVNVKTGGTYKSTIDYLKSKLK